MHQIDQLWLNLSVRIHRVSFLHPSLDESYDSTTFVFPHQQGNKCKAKRAHAVDPISNNISDIKADEIVKKLILSERQRLSRDGILNAQNNLEQMDHESGSNACMNSSLLPKGVRNILLSTHKCIPEELSALKTTNSSSTFTLTNRSRIQRSPENSQIPRTALQFAELLQTSQLSTIGRFMPEAACRVPSQSIYFQLSLSNRKIVRATQPFVVEAPHVVWGSRDYNSSIGMNPLIDQRKLEFVSDAESYKAIETESLMVIPISIKFSENHMSENSKNRTLKANVHLWNTFPYRFQIKIPRVPLEASSKLSSSFSVGIDHNKTIQSAQEMRQLLIKNDTVYLKVVGFPSRQLFASFPVRIATLLHSDNMTSFDNFELTTNLLRPPSFNPLGWGVEVQVTFRCVISNQMYGVPRRQRSIGGTTCSGKQTTLDASTTARLLFYDKEYFGSKTDA